MICIASPYAYYLARARIEVGEGRPAKIQVATFPAIGQAIRWAEGRVAHDERMSHVDIFGIHTANGFADQVLLGAVDSRGWLCLVEDDPMRPLA